MVEVSILHLAPPSLFLLFHFHLRCWRTYAPGFNYSLLVLECFELVSLVAFPLLPIIYIFRPYLLVTSLTETPCCIWCSESSGNVLVIPLLLHPMCQSIPGDILLTSATPWHWRIFSIFLVWWCLRCLTSKFRCWLQNFQSSRWHFPRSVRLRLLLTLLYLWSVKSFSVLHFIYVKYICSSSLMTFLASSRSACL